MLRFRGISLIRSKLPTQHLDPRSLPLIFHVFVVLMCPNPHTKYKLQTPSLSGPTNDITLIFDCVFFLQTF